jgi:general secretion pathway protein G
MKSRKRRNRAERGMTLIEIMVVITILGMIAAAVSIQVINSWRTAQRDTVTTDFKTIESQLEMYALRKGRLPEPSQGLSALVSEGISRELPKDPWGTPYQYIANGSEVTLTSLGGDAASGGTDLDADIVRTIKFR